MVVAAFSKNLQNEFISKRRIGTDFAYKHEVVWKNVFGFLILHLLAIYGFVFLVFRRQFIPCQYLLVHRLPDGKQCSGLTWSALAEKIQNPIQMLSNDFLISLQYVFIYGYMGGLGITVGAHRYYTHRTFEAKLSLRILILFLQTASGQNSMFEWVRDHRLHHRYSDTDADPHNAKRGFFFSHMGWLMCKKHPYVIELGRKIDMSDLLADPLVMFQKKYYLYLFLTLLLIQTSIPVYFCNMNWMEAIISFMAEYVYGFHGTWLVNSAAHLYGTRPYDKNLQPVESWYVSLVTLGEGWHNYHHAYPWDYKAAEDGMHFNFSATVIRFFASIGQAYDLKTASPDMVEKRIMSTGDGTHCKLGDDESRASVKAWGPLHPLNPTFTTTMKQPEAILKPEGLPLFYEDGFPGFE